MVGNQLVVLACTHLQPCPCHHGGGHSGGRTKDETDLVFVVCVKGSCYILYTYFTTVCWHSVHPMAVQLGLAVWHCHS